jgi:hypothetical protein
MFTCDTPQNTAVGERAQFDHQLPSTDGIFRYVNTITLINYMKIYSELFDHTQLPLLLWTFN